jgi:hypothetical protein
MQGATVQDLPPYRPEVEQASEFLEISRDFTRPQEIVREAVSNSYDAKASRIQIDVYVDRSSGEEQLIVSILDDGHGMDEDQLKAFFDLGRSTRNAVDERGFRTGDFIGSKGHGTKIYYNSSRIEVETWRDGAMLTARVDDPKKHLLRKELPEVRPKRIVPAPEGSGTKVRVIGYNHNESRGFSHRELRDYVYWFTKWASFEQKVARDENAAKVIHLKGLGGPEEGEDLSFGHVFPPENTSMTDLRRQDRVEPMRYYVKRWIFPNEPIQGYPQFTLDMIVSLEGDSAKLQHNDMLRRRGREIREGDYIVGDRYGLWICKDFIPIQRINQWVSDKGYEWTRYHAFVNCQALELTANRSDVENTPKPFLEALGQTVQSLLDRITSSEEYRKFEEALEAEGLYKSARQEVEDFTRRRRFALDKRVSAFENRELVEPRQEAGVFGLFATIKALRPDLFNFDIVDYDTQRGYDALARARDGLDPTQTNMRFVEFKKELTKDFSHSFARLFAVVCWECKLPNESEVQDLEGKTRHLIITPKGADETHKKYVLRTDEPVNNIEVFVLKDYLSDRLGLEFHSRTS